MQLEKGKRGERELFSLISDELGITVTRALGAARDGGCDSLDIPGWSPEVKRTEVYANAYWRQACEQAEETGRLPVLFWRPSRKPWVALVDLADVAPHVFPRRNEHEPAQLSLAAWTHLVRKQLGSKGASGLPGGARIAQNVTADTEV